MSLEKRQALLQLDEHGKELSYEEVGSLLALAYPETTVQMFVDTFLTFVDWDQFDSDTGHVDCPIACVEAVLAYQSAGGQLLPHL